MNSTYNILDFETTGFSSEYDRVIEIGVVKIKNNKIVDSFQEFVNPNLNISNAITSLTGITNEMVMDADTSSKVMPRLKDFVEDELIVAHNASFDSRFFMAEMNRNDMFPQNEFLCSLLLARRIYQNLNSHKLENLCSYLDLTNNAAHRALDDAKVTYEVFNSICKTIKENTGKSDLDYEYLRLLSKTPKKKIASFLRSIN